MNFPISSLYKVISMKISIPKNTIIMLILLIVGVTILDYANVPTLLGLDISGINWDFYMGALNIISVVAVFIITFKTLNNKQIIREKNKYDISLLLLRNCYKECRNYIQILNKENVEKYIVPKIDFNSINPKIISNLQNAPFDNENIIMDLVKDGQLSQDQISGYFNVKCKFGEYVNIRITFFDAPCKYNPLKKELSDLLDKEAKKIDSLI